MGAASPMMRAFLDMMCGRRSIFNAIFSTECVGHSSISSSTSGSVQGRARSLRARPSGPLPGPPAMAEAVHGAATDFKYVDHQAGMWAVVLECT